MVRSGSLIRAPIEGGRFARRRAYRRSKSSGTSAKCRWIPSSYSVAIRSSSSSIWRVECLAGGAHSQLCSVTPDSRGVTSAFPQCASRSSSNAAWMLFASATSYCCRAFTIVERTDRSCMMSSRCSYSQRRAKISSCCRSRVRVSSSRKGAGCKIRVKTCHSARRLRNVG